MTPIKKSLITLVLLVSYLHTSETQSAIQELESATTDYTTFKKEKTEDIKALILTSKRASYIIAQREFEQTFNKKLVDAEQYDK